MEKEIIDEITNGAKWYEKTIILSHKKLILKIYHKIRLNIVNQFINK